MSRGLQHASPLVLLGTLSLLQQVVAAMQLLLAPVEELAAALTDAAAKAAAAVAVADAAPARKQAASEQLLQPTADQVLLQHNLQLQRDCNVLLHSQGQQQQVQHDLSFVAQAQQAALLQQAALSWCGFLQSWRHSLRRRLPEVAVLVAVITGLQKVAAAGPSMSVGVSGAAPSLQQQHQDSPAADEVDWLLQQACLVLGAYARWLPEAVVDGHVDLGKLLLQGQGQVGAWLWLA